MTRNLPARTRVRALVLGAAVVATASALTVPALTSANAASGAKWTVISSGNVGNTIETPSIAKFGKDYEAVWVAQLASSKFELEARILNAAGKPIGGVINVLGASWTGIDQDPTIVGIGGTRYIAFAGNDGQADTYNLGVEDYVTSSDGHTWAFGEGSLSQTTSAVNDGGTAVSVVKTSGAADLWAAMAIGAGVTYHQGITDARPANTADHLTRQPGFSAAPGLAQDAKTGAVWVLMASGNGGAKKDGVWAQEVSPTKGSLIHAPGSYADGGATSFGVQQDLSAAPRAGGGVYTAYVTPARKSIDVWKVGAKHPFATIKDLQGPSDVIVTPGPAGRIWVYWRDDSAWHAARSNKAATRFGPTSTIGTPKGDISNLEIAGAGSSGPLEAIGLLTTSKNVNEVVEHQFLPRLSVKVSPTSVKKGHSFTVTVTDAGDAVKGATVHFNGSKKKTNSKGKVTFKVTAGTSTGKHQVTLTLSGYAAASATVKVT